MIPESGQEEEVKGSEEAPEAVPESSKPQTPAPVEEAGERGEAEEAKDEPTQQDSPSPAEPIAVNTPVAAVEDAAEVSAKPEAEAAEAGEEEAKPTEEAEEKKAE